MIVRHWFPVMTLGATLFLALAIVAVFSRDTRSDERVPAEAPAVRERALSEESYDRAILAILGDWQAQGDARSAHEQLLYVAHIPASRQDVHLGLVGAFGLIASGNKDAGLARLEVLRAQYSWLTL